MLVIHRKKYMNDCVNICLIILASRQKLKIGKLFTTKFFLIKVMLAKGNWKSNLGKAKSKFLN